jgi:paired small multidrug resistance pump
MNKTWAMVIFAALFEVMWVAGLKYADSVLTWALTVIAIVISFGVLIYSAKKLPTSTVYAIFVGLGTAGTVISEMLFFGEPFKLSKLVLIGVLLAAIIGMKMVTPDHGEGDTAKREGKAS